MIPYLSTDPFDKNLPQLARICEQKFGILGEGCLLFPTSTVANHCRDFIIRQAAKENLQFPVRITQFLLQSDEKCREICAPSMKPGAELHIVLFPADKIQYAKPFWQHTGLGVSSRYAEHCLSFLPEEAIPTSPTIHSKPKFAHRYYSVKDKRKSIPAAPGDALSDDQSTYLEERYGRNLSQDASAFAKRALRRRIAGVLLRDEPAVWDAVGSTNSELKPSARGHGVTEDDVYLYPTGMAAIWNAHQTIFAVRPAAKSVAFGFVLTLSMWDPRMESQLTSVVDGFTLILLRF